MITNMKVFHEHQIPTLALGVRMGSVETGIACPMELRTSVILLVMDQGKVPAVLQQDSVGTQLLTAPVQAVSTMGRLKVWIIVDRLFVTIVFRAMET